MGIVLVLSIILIYLLLTINKGIPPEVKPGCKEDVTVVEKKSLLKKCLFSSEWHKAMKMEKSFTGMLNSDCMKARGLFKDDVIIARPVLSRRGSLKKGDLIIIKMVDEDAAGPERLVISEYNGDLGDGFIQTINYREYNPVISRKRRSRDIIAVVDSHIRSEALLYTQALAN